MEQATQEALELITLIAAWAFIGYGFIVAGYGVFATILGGTPNGEEWDKREQGMNRISVAITWFGTLLVTLQLYFNDPNRAEKVLVIVLAVLLVVSFVLTFLVKQEPKIAKCLFRIKRNIDAPIKTTTARDVDRPLTVSNFIFSGLAIMGVAIALL